jgi:general secretion pathway protein G
MTRKTKTSLRIGCLLAILCILILGAAMYRAMPALTMAKIARAQADINTIGIALMTYRSLGGMYPTTAQGLDALVTRPTTEPRPKQWNKSMDENPLDPWGNPYHYLCPGKHDPKGYDLYSDGGDTREQIGNWPSD